MAINRAVKKSMSDGDADAAGSCLATTFGNCETTPATSDVPGPAVAVSGSDLGPAAVTAGAATVVTGSPLINSFARRIEATVDAGGGSVRSLVVKKRNVA